MRITLRTGAIIGVSPSSAWPKWAPRCLTRPSSHPSIDPLLTSPFRTQLFCNFLFSIGLNCHLLILFIIFLPNFSNGAQPDFQLKLEVYSCMLQDDLSIASTPRKLQKSLHSSISRTLGRKLSATLKDANSQKADMYVQYVHVNG